MESSGRVEFCSARGKDAVSRYLGWLGESRKLGEQMLRHLELSLDQSPFWCGGGTVRDAG